MQPREVLLKGSVRVFRPVKCAHLRLTALDDSVIKEEAVATEKGCLPDDVQARQRFQDGNLWIRCPVGAAKKLALNGGLKFGWATAPVKLLPRRILRCYSAPPSVPQR